ncbi:hypothetical protein V8F20_012693 [Naviculisporaceae sp. PSN 640]
MDHTSIPKMQEAISAHNPNNNYSTLEVAIGAPDYDKEVVHPPHYPFNQDQQQYYLQQQQQTAQGLEGHDPSTWQGVPESAVANPSTADDPKRRICGIKRKSFFIIAWEVTLVIAVAIGVGAGLGATMRSRNGDGNSQGAAGATTTGTERDAVTGSATTGHAKTPGISDSALTIPTSSPATRKDDTKLSTIPSTLETLITTATQSPTIITSPPIRTTNLPPPTFVTISTKTPQIGGPGGRCQNEWGSDCICLDQGICVNKWKGTPYTGFEGNWPCPDDPDNIMACVVKPCLGQDITGQTQCLWREGCSQVLSSGGGGTGAPICPGDEDFVCCAHPW